jgi:transposase
MHESRHVVDLLVGVEAKCELEKRAYDGAPIRDAITEMGAKAVIPLHPCHKAPAAYNAHLGRARHAIENLFARLKQYRSLATCYGCAFENSP